MTPRLHPLKKLVTPLEKRKKTCLWPQICPRYHDSGDYKANFLMSVSTWSWPGGMFTYMLLKDQLCTVHLGETRQNSCSWLWGVRTSLHPAIVLRRRWPGEKFHLSVWLIASPHPDTGLDFRSKFTVEVPNLSMHLSHAHSDSSIYSVTMEAVNSYQNFCLPSVAFPSWMDFASSQKSLFCNLQSLNCSCCYLYHAFRKAGNFLIALNIFCVHNTMGTVISCIFRTTNSSQTTGHWGQNINRLHLGVLRTDHRHKFIFSFGSKLLWKETLFSQPLV